MQDAATDNSTAANHTVTQNLAAFVANFRAHHVSPTALTWATHSLLDWSAVTLAAHAEPLVTMLRDEFADEQAGPCTLIGQNRTARLHDATLINGAAGHALDYDDVVRPLGGHPSVPVMPVVLALGEQREVSGAAVLAAIVAGFEVECALGAMTGASHYERGFHNTGTIGTFGATAAACHLLGLDADTIARAFGLAASQAAGLKCNFGTMTKPFHAGAAAANGLRAARLAARGFTASPCAIEAPQGFAATQVPAFVPSAMRCDPHAAFAVEHNLFKFHAACYGTHAALEGIRTLREVHAIGLDDMAHMMLHLPTRAAGNCDQRDPETGLQMKFSVRHLAVMGLGGADTAALDVYSAENATHPRYVEARQRVEAVFSDEGRDRMTATVVLTTRDGQTLTANGDVGRPATDLDHQWQKLSAKFEALAEPVIGAARTEQARSAIARLSDASDLSDMMAALA
ncbi:MAG: MmgE/PrpD family protein [Pseudomonadota bacterium]